MSKSKIAVVIIGGAINGALAACSIVWPDKAGLVAAGVGLVTVAVASITGMNLEKA